MRRSIGTTQRLSSPPGADAPYAFAQPPTTFAWVDSADTSLAWRATALGGTTSVFLSDQPSHVVTPDAVGTSGTGYVAILEENGLGIERVAFAWFDTATSVPATISRSTVGRTVNSIYVTYDATSNTALGVAAEGTQSYLLVARPGASAGSVASWTSSSPRPIVSRGDGTFFVHDGTSYGLRSVSAPTSVIAAPGDPGALGAGVVVDGHYAYFAIVDLVADRMQLHLHRCL